MPLQVDVQELKEGLTIFRRGDVQHQNWYCRIKLPKVDRYKTISLKTADLREARNKAFDQDAEARFSLKHGVLQKQTYSNIRFRNRGITVSRYWSCSIYVHGFAFHLAPYPLSAPANQKICPREIEGTFR